MTAATAKRPKTAASIPATSASGSGGGNLAVRADDCKGRCDKEERAERKLEVSSRLAGQPVTFPQPTVSSVPERLPLPRTPHAGSIARNWSNR